QAIWIFGSVVKAWNLHCPHQIFLARFFSIGRTDKGNYLQQIFCLILLLRQRTFIKDTMFSVGSFVVIVLLLWINMGSLFLSLMGILAIALSYPWYQPQV